MQSNTDPSIREDDKMRLIKYNDIYEMEVSFTDCNGERKEHTLCFDHPASDSEITEALDKKYLIVDDMQIESVYIDQYLS